MILVTGATGNVGRHVVSELVDAGAGVRALTRDPSRAALPAAAEVAGGDLADPAGLDAALRGVDTVFLLWPFFTADGVRQVLEAVGRQRARLVFLSSMAVPDDWDDGRPAPVFHAEVERLIEKSGLEWTFLRPGGFAANTLGWAPQIRADGVVRWPYGAAARSLIHERDIAAVAVRALTGDGHAGARYVLTGPAALTQVEQVQAIGAAIGRPLRYQEIAPEEARRQLLDAWGDPSFVDGALDYWASLVTQPEPVTHTVQEVTGEPARTFSAWAADHAADFGRPARP